MLVVVSAGVCLQITVGMCDLQGSCVQDFLGKVFSPVIMCYLSSCPLGRLPGIICLAIGDQQCLQKPDQDVYYKAYRVFPHKCPHFFYFA